MAVIVRIVYSLHLTRLTAPQVKPDARVLRVDVPVDYADKHPIYASDRSVSSDLSKLRRDPEYQRSTFLKDDGAFLLLSLARGQTISKMDRP